ncbi:SufD family Fe-S cluster assembly protein [Erysipelotrichaceae bacterium OttesenSCG-928-M19]|nr:SufD family Fe-S cluster assembly protein [Erysipelotrichaceae bacterium OttesenSCG-928-M19]
MKHFIEITKEQVHSDLEYNNNDEIIEFFVTESTDIDLLIADSAKKIKFSFFNNIASSLTTIINCNSELNLEYQINDNAYVYESVVIENDDLNIQLNKQVVVTKEATYEASNGLFSDCHLTYNVNIDLNGLAAQALHNIATISRNESKKIYNVTINNNYPLSYGELNNFGVVKDQASLIFNGTGYIKNGAKQAQAHQESKIITFDPLIIAEANPYLIIDEADVEASHAAAVGQMDEEQLYYIQSRGIDFENATRLITYGYLKPILNKISDESLKEKLEKLIETKVML